MTKGVPYAELTTDSQPHYRSLPHNMEAEQGLLGALLVDNRGLEKVGDFLKPLHFFTPVHARIYEAVLTLVDRGQNASPVTLKGYFENDPELEPLGGAAYLADLAANVISVVNTEDYAQTIYELHLRRELITLGEDVVNEAFEHDLDRSANDTIETAEARLFTLAESGDSRAAFTTLRDSVMVAIELAEKAYKTQGNVTGVTTGLTDMDKKLGVCKIPTFL
ncbi:MAG: replicative DNA helicase, partial [Alphaproteobacteria bacterium]|nr:replicative DNA helicase [Alphaproteobacteria bacterium]